MVNIGVIGYGYWGPNLVRNFVDAPGCRLVAVSDLSTQRLTLIGSRYPGVKTYRDYRDLLDDTSIDAVAVATPVSSHFQIAMEALRAGKHVLVEKPLTTSTEEGKRLVDEAELRKRVLMVDHTFVYTGAVRKIRECVGGLGQLYYYDSVRVNLGLFQHDVNVLWDLAVHDLSIMDYILPEKPTAVVAAGTAHIHQSEDIAYLTCYFESNLIGHFHVNWLAPVKIRRSLICGDKRMIVYDDLEPSEKVKIYDKGITLTNGNNGNNGRHQLLVGYRTGDMNAPQLETTEALQVEARHFVECITQGAKPITDGLAGLRVVGILEAATQSLLQRGKLIELRGEAGGL